MRRPGSLVLSLFFFAAAAHAHELPSGNLGALGRIWGIVEYAHPWLGYRDVDLDASTIRAIARLQSSPHDISGAVSEMLAVLGDDAAFVRPPCVERNAPAVDRSARTLANGIVYVSATAPVDASTLALLRTAKAAVVDLRPQPGRCTAPMVAQELIPLLVRGSVARADLRKVKHHGYRSQDPAAEEPRFQSGFVTIDTGFESGNAEVAKVVFIVNDRSYIPPFATALAAAETAAFVTVGRFPLASALDHCEIGLPDGGIVTLRTSELVDADGYGAEPSPMITFAADAPEGDVIAAALQLAKPRASRRRASGPRSVGLRLPDYEWRPEATYADMQFPDAAHRIFAAYRIWNVIHFFHARPGDEWSMQFGEMIAMLEHATTRQQYELALAEILGRLPDGQASASTRAPLALPPFRLMPVEDKPVVIESATASVKPGDELLRIDGRDVNEGMTELARYVSGSTAAAKRYAIARELVTGAAGSQSVFTFRRPDGTTYDVTLTRAPQAPNQTKPWRILDGGIAYVDARHLDAEEIATLFTEVAGTRAMIVDLRGESRVADDLAMRMNATGASAASLVRVPELIGGAFDAAEVAQQVSASSLPPYTGRTIALIDERTQGGGEATALLLAAVANAEFVGVPSAGATGPTTSLVVPGNILIHFTGGEARYTDGRPVHGVGIRPDYEVTRTIRGLAEGKDAALEKALDVLR